MVAEDVALCPPSVARCTLSAMASVSLSYHRHPSGPSGGFRCNLERIRRDCCEIGHENIKQLIMLIMIKPHLEPYELNTRSCAAGIPEQPGIFEARGILSLSSE